ncbi:MAG: hypothetical protein ACE5DN_00915 [Flavobacteriales bacterium]
MNPIRVKTSHIYLLMVTFGNAQSPQIPKQVWHDIVVELNETIQPWITPVGSGAAYDFLPNFATC